MNNDANKEQRIREASERLDQLIAQLKLAETEVDARQEKFARLKKEIADYRQDGDKKAS